MNTLHLEYFMSIAQHKSINKAAQALFINRSSLMNALTSLENELGVSLFERTPSGVTLTKKGQEVYTGAIEIFNIINFYNHFKLLLNF